MIALLANVLPSWDPEKTSNFPSIIGMNFVNLPIKILKFEIKNLHYKPMGIFLHLVFIGKWRGKGEDQNTDKNQGTSRSSVSTKITFRCYKLGKLWHEVGALNSHIDRGHLWGCIMNTYASEIRKGTNNRRMYTIKSEKYITTDSTGSYSTSLDRGSEGSDTCNKKESGNQVNLCAGHCDYV